MLLCALRHKWWSQYNTIHGTNHRERERAQKVSSDGKPGDVCESPRGHPLGVAALPEACKTLDVGTKFGDLKTSLLAVALPGSSGPLLARASLWKCF